MLSLPTVVVPISIIATFQRVKALTTDVQAVVDALRGSDKLVLNGEGSKVRRKDPLPPEYNAAPRTIYAVRALLHHSLHLSSSLSLSLPLSLCLCFCVFMCVSLFDFHSLSALNYGLSTK